MGGSAVGGRLAIGALGSRLTRPMVVADGYALPGLGGAVDARLRVALLGQHRGDAVGLRRCRRRGARRGSWRPRGGALAARARADGVPVVPIPGGFQPRAAIGYSLVGALEAAALGGAAPSVRSEIEAAAALVVGAGRRVGAGRAGGLARPSRSRVALHGTVPVIAGAELAAPAAYRWKCQFNENSALPAFASVLPEADHNEVVGWDAAAELGRFSYVSLEDPGAHPRNALRAGLTAEIAAAGASPVLRVEARGETPVERIVSLVLLGDLVSIYAAVLRSADPVDIPGIDRVKAALSAAPVSS